MPDPAALLTTVLAGPLTEVQVGPAMQAPVVLRAEVRAVLDTTGREARHIEDPVELRTTAQEGPLIAAPVGLAMRAPAGPAIQVLVGWLNAAQQFAVARRCLEIGGAHLEANCPMTVSRYAWRQVTLLASVQCCMVSAGHEGGGCV